MFPYFHPNVLAQSGHPSSLPNLKVVISRSRPVYHIKLWSFRAASLYCKLLVSHPYHVGSYRDTNLHPLRHADIVTGGIAHLESDADNNLVICAVDVGD